MKIVLAVVLTSTLVASSALACGYGKSAKHKVPTTTATVDDAVTEEAMTTYDPAKAPVFEENADRVEVPSTTEVKPQIE